MIKHFIMAGQSNMEGRGELSEFPSSIPALDTGNRIWSYRYDETWQQNPPEPIHDRTGIVYTALDGNYGVGPCLTFADHFARYHTSHDVGLIPAAKGGTVITDWARPADGVDTSTYYGAMRARWEAALASKPGELAGFAWWQGASDALTQAGADAWAAGFLQLCADVRSDTGIPNLPIVFVQVGPRQNEESNPEWTSMQDQQAAIITPDKTFMATAKGLTLLNEVDAAHVNTASQVIMGKRLADAFRILGAGV